MISEVMIMESDRRTTYRAYCGTRYLGSFKSYNSPLREEEVGALYRTASKEMQKLGSDCLVEYGHLGHACKHLTVE